jgi:hypothetical protein
MIITNIGGVLVSHKPACRQAGLPDGKQRHQEHKEIFIDS